jgi:hypothetical protein
VNVYLGFLGINKVKTSQYILSRIKLATKVILQEIHSMHVTLRSVEYLNPNENSLDGTGTH